MKKMFPILIPAVACAILFMAADLMADTIILYQGSVMVGKIVSEDEASIILANYHGTFRIKRIKIDDIYKTESYTEDIELLRKLDLPYNEEIVKRHYLAGQVKKEKRLARIKKEPAAEEEAAPPKKEEKKKEEEKEKPAPPEEKKEREAPPEALKPDHWNSGRISLSGAFHYNLGSSSGAMPFGFAGYLALDQGLDFTSGDRKPGIPGLRFEGGYLSFKSGSYSISGFIAGGGLMWALPSMKNSWGCFIIALIPGATYLKMKVPGVFPGFGSGTSSGVNFAGQALFGYQKSWGVFSLFVQARYMYIHASGSYFHTIGGEAGFGFNAW